ncbi:hypothetical protein DLE01_12925 [Streptomyces sp. FT05W]|uniref:Lipoprotein n=2 Tax=Streptomyces TaxID=1883 RepID=A0A8D3WHN3_STRFA|nr:MULTISPECIES: hypothetical protein [Streptomyces]MBD2833492.1 hypothetical protein [Streptomyces pratensis]RAS30391.1 hypothetical protein BCL80_106516 [Streptomyces avidinii]TPM85866.1 hypothetical protein FKO01_59040 [Mesorhizobium sp. B2-3-3]SNX78114.1 hypothetical protein SAMN05421860_105519 [Streptomyces microflavus]AGJ56832.1 hypothetical protein F750_4391 [Streptomyces sp. PAMC 26508]
MDRRKLRSGTVVLGGMGVLAATLTACGSEPDRRCVDRVTQEILPRYECEDSNGSGSYYYGGSSHKNRVSGGSFDKSAVDRGGFGSSGSSGG